MFTNGLQAGLPQQVLDQSNLTNLGHSRICQVTGIAFIRGGPPTSVLTQTGYSRLSLCYYVLLFPRIFTFVDHAKLCVCVCWGLPRFRSNPYHICWNPVMLHLSWLVSFPFGWSATSFFSHPNFIVPGKAPCLVLFPLYTLFMFVFYRIIAHAH